MKNAWRLLLCVFLVLPLFSISVYAEDIYSYAGKEFEVDRLEDILTEDEREISGSIENANSYDAGGALARLWKSFLTRIISEFKKNIDSFSSLVALAIISTMGSALCNEKDVKAFIEIIGCGSAALMILGNMESIVTQTTQAMYRLSDYSKAALPVVFSAAAAGGAVSSAAAKFAAVSFALDVLMSVSQRLIIPTVYSFLALTVANSMFPNPLLGGFQKICKWAAGTLMTGMTLAFTTYIGMIGAIGSAVDTAAVKTARTFISGALPVVGGMISDASAMLLSAAGVIRNCAGVFGLVSVAVICAGPFAMLSVKLLLLKAVASISDSMQNNRLTLLYSGLGSAMSLLLGLLGSSGIMLFISLTAGIKAVSI